MTKKAERNVGSRKFRPGLIVFFCILIFCSQAFAASGHSAPHGEHEALTFGSLLAHLKYYWINFILYVAGLWYLLAKAWPGVATARKAALEKSILEAQRELELAKEVMQHAEKRWEGLGQEKINVEKIIAEETKSLSDSKIAAAMETARRLLAQTKERASIERLAASRWFRKNLLEKAQGQVHQDLLKSPSSELDSKYNSKAIEAIKNLVN